MNSNLLFSDDISNLNVEDALVVCMNYNVTNKQELFNDYNQKLDFPSYFGHNWDALNDCLCNLGNLASHNIVLVYERLPQISDNEIRILVEILYDVTSRLKEYDIYHLYVVFPTNAMPFIESLLHAP